MLLIVKNIFHISVFPLALHSYYTVYCRSGLGNHYGTLGGPVEAVSAALRPKEKYKAPGKNFTTNPGKIGTGYG